MIESNGWPFFIQSSHRLHPQGCLPPHCTLPDVRLPGNERLPLVSSLPGFISNMLAATLHSTRRASTSLHLYDVGHLIALDSSCLVSQWVFWASSSRWWQPHCTRLDRSCDPWFTDYVTVSFLVSLIFNSYSPTLNWFFIEFNRLMSFIFQFPNRN
jgi:hypothetical protein